MSMAEVAVLTIICAGLAIVAVGVSAWARALYRDRQALARQVELMQHEFGEVAQKAARVRLLTLQVEQLESACHQIDARRAATLQDFATYTRDIGLRREAEEFEMRAYLIELQWRRATAEAEVAAVYQAFEVERVKVEGEVEARLAGMHRELEELALAQAEQRQKQAAAEEQRLLREQMREEEGAQRALRLAQEDAEKEERRLRFALDRARAEFRLAVGPARETLEAKIAQLSGKLTEAQAQKQEAVARAKQTTAGYVYVLSNVGSFGDQVYKIAMTRRLDPLERVAELGDAAVPFPFDVHAMIYSDDAAELERRLHEALHDRRVNRVDERKAFFRVDLEEVEQATAEIAAALPGAGGGTKFSKLAAAEQYQKSLAMEQSPAYSGEFPIARIEIRAAS